MFLNPEKNMTFIIINSIEVKHNNCAFCDNSINFGTNDHKGMETNPSYEATSKFYQNLFGVESPYPSYLHMSPSHCVLL